MNKITLLPTHLSKRQAISGYIFLSKKDIGDVVYQDSFSGEATKETTYTFYIPKADKETALN